MLKRTILNPQIKSLDWLSPEQIANLVYVLENKVQVFHKISNF